MADYNPRLTDAGMQGNKYWYSSQNPFYPEYGLPNCTCYAWGRFWEISDVLPHLPTGNAEDWWAATPADYQKGQTPALGAVACFADGPYSGDGHVSIVEVIDADGTVTFSNSAWGGAYFYLKSGNASNNWGYEPEYIFQGFIYNPEQPIPPEPPVGNKKKMSIALYGRIF